MRAAKARGAGGRRNETSAFPGHDSPKTRQRLLRDAGRAAGGALIFSLPMMMTQEMWQLGALMPPLRLMLLILASLPLLVELSRQLGLKHSLDWRANLLETLLALGIGAAVSTVVLGAFSLLSPAMSAREFVGKVALQTVPAAIGALLARSQMGDAAQDKMGDQKETYGGELLLMAVGALFLGFNIAPTEETMLIAYRMSDWNGIALVALSLVIMHGFVFAVGFKGGSELSPETPWWSAFARFTLPGYAIALLISHYMLWSFGRTDGEALSQIAMAVIVLGVPTSVGAAAARLIL